MHTEAKTNAVWHRMLSTRRIMGTAGALSTPRWRR